VKVESSYCGKRFSVPQPQKPNSHRRQLQTCGLSKDITALQTDEATSGTSKGMLPIQAHKFKSRSVSNYVFMGPSSVTLRMRNDKVKEDEMGRACSTNGAKRSACGILVGKPEGKRPLGRPRCKRVDSINMDLREIRRDVWTGFIWLRIGTSGGLL
jgi:hypothetical protein